MVPNKDLKRVQRGCTNKEIRKLLLSVMRGGHRYRMTKCGVTVFGPEGSAGAHLTTSDHRGAENFKADLKKIGIDIEKGTP